ncbi:MAG TPA: PaaX family transcriptional regulator C-terminal domain-containing protein [bacterium]|nr:PaaX family transcriptional regulator C-terminal domain-containing protein [bacterium]
MQARSMLFTLFGDYVRHYGGTIWIGSLIALMAELGFTAPAVRAAVSRMTRQGWLYAIREGRASYYALTQPGQRRIEEAARRIFKLQPEPWDGVWRVLALDAPADRDRRAGLRRELAWMGFTPLARGVHLSPNDLLELVTGVAERYGVTGRIEMFAARHLGESSEPDLVARRWDLRAIDRAYAGFLDAWKPRWQARRDAGDAQPLSDAAAFAEKTRLVHEFRKFLFVDPGLPQDLLPPRWSGTEARGLFSAYYHLLSEGALRFFEAHYRPAPGHEGDLPAGRRAARRDPFRPAAPAG